jgi:hypothetical protein
MLKRRFSATLGFVATAAFIGCQTGTDPNESRSELAIAASGKGAVQGTEPIAFTVPDCEGGAISASGGLHTVIRIQKDGKGRYHVMLHENLQDLIGINSAGDTLTGEGAGQVTGVFNLLPQTVVDTFQVTFISSDATDTLVVSFEATITFNADGTVSTSYCAPTTTCGPDAGTSFNWIEPSQTVIAEAADGISDYAQRFAWRPRMG